MKKKYIKPNCLICTVEAQYMLALSLEVDNTPGNDLTGDVNFNGGFTDIWGNEL